MILKIITTIAGLAAIAITLDTAFNIYAMWGSELANGQTLNLTYLLSEQPDQASVLDSIAK